MRFNVAAAALAVASIASAQPFKFPLPNGFPNPSPANLNLIQERAGGTLPNVPLPTELSDDAATTFQLITFNEIFEVAFFSQLLNNITNGVKGYKAGPFVHQSLFQIRAQEELHALAGNAALETAGRKTIKPCQYQFPVNDLISAVALAQTFTDVVLGVLPQAQTLFGQDGGAETGLVAVIGSILGQEAQQVGNFRTLQKKRFSAAPFLTGGSPVFAWSALQMFVVPGSCPKNQHIDIPILKPLTPLGKPTATNSVITYTVKGKVDKSKHEVTYISGQNFPVTVPITSVTTKGGVTSFKASFPFVKKGFAKGLTLAAVTKKSTAKFESAADVADAALYGPGLIEVD